MTASWWIALANGIAAVGTIAAVWVAVASARTARSDTRQARRDEVLARQAETIANQRAVDAEARFRQEQLDYEKARRAEERQRVADAEAVRLFAMHGSAFRFYGAWTRFGDPNMFRYLQVTITNESLIAFTDVRIEVFARLDRMPPEPAWHAIALFDSFGGKHAETPEARMFNTLDGSVPPLRAEFTDQQHNRWLIDEHDEVTLLSPRVIKSGARNTEA